MVALTQADATINTQSGSVIITANEGAHVAAQIGSNEPVFLDELPTMLSSGLDSIQSSLSEQASIHMATTTAAESSTNSRLSIMESAVTELEQYTNDEISNIRSNVTQSILDSASTVTEQLESAESATRSALSRLSDELESGLDEVLSAAREADQRAQHAMNASICAASGLLYDTETARCFPRGIGPPDFETSWLPMRSQAGTQGYREIFHRLNVDPERVQVLIRPDDNAERRQNTLYFEGLGAGTCDDDSACNDYGGIVYGWDNNRVRIWAPDRSNGRTSGRSISIHDGWGANRRNVVVTYVQVLVRVWASYRRGVEPSHDSNFTMTTSAATNYRQVTHTANTNINSSLPERVMVTVEAVDGPNRGFKFMARGASMVDNDGSKDYGGLVFAYNQGVVRLWAPSSSNGGIIFNNDGWGGERNVQKSRTGRVRVRVWGAENAVEPSFTSTPFQMCSNCRTGSCNQYTPSSYGWSFREVFVGGPKLPNYVKVETHITDNGNNNGFVFEGISSAGMDDEHDGRTGLVFGYDTENVVLWAPTRSNGRTSGRIAGVHDGWGNGRFNSAHQCVNVVVKTYD